MSEITHMSWGGKPLLVRDLLSHPFFLGVAIGLLLRIMLWHMLDWPSSQWEVFADDLLLVQIFVFALQALSSPAPMPFPHAGTSSEVPLPGLPLLLPPSLQKGGMRVGGLGMPLCCFPGVFLSSRLDCCPARGVEEPLVARSVHASSLLSPRFIRGLGVQVLLSCGDSCYPLCPGWLSLLISARPARWWGGRGFGVPLQLGFLPGFLIFGLGSQEGALSPLLVGWLSWPVLLLTLSLRFLFTVKWEWIVSVAVFPCEVAVRSLAVFGPLAVSLRSL